MARGGAVAAAMIVLAIAPVARAANPHPSVTPKPGTHAPATRKPSAHAAPTTRKGAAPSASTTRKGAAQSPFTTRKGAAAQSTSATRRRSTSPEASRPARTRDAAAASAAAGACRPCEHADDCPKITCECDRSTGTDVSACDTDETHCCASGRETCIAFCAAHDETWTGKFGPAAPAASTAPGETAAPSDEDAAAGATCLHQCSEPADCPTVSCQCKRTVARNVAACDERAKCCGDERVVCEHYCRAQKDQWTGKLAEDEAPPPDDDEVPDLLAPPDAPVPDLPDDDAD